MLQMFKPVTVRKKPVVILAHLFAVLVPYIVPYVTVVNVRFVIR